MFARHRGTTRVPAGTYFCLDTGTWVNLPADGPLPGSGENRYVRTSVLATLILGPLSGLLFVVSLPLLVPAFLLWRLVGRFRKGSPPTAAPAGTAPMPDSPSQTPQPALDREDSHSVL